MQHQLSLLLLFPLFILPALFPSLSARENPSHLEPIKDFDAVYFLGHLNPDADAIFGAIAAADLFHGIPARSGALNAESRYILEKFSLPLPLLIENTPDKKYFLIDFNQKTQLLAGVQPHQIVGIIDHHAIQSAFAGPAIPIDLLIRAWGSSCTLITDLYLQKNTPISPAIAGGLLGGILSDTLNLTSPTTTAADRSAVPLLAKIAGIDDTTAFAQELFREKSRTTHLTAMEILTQDLKHYEINGKKIGMGVVETIFPEEVLLRQNELFTAMREVKTSAHLAYLLFAIVQPETKESVLLVLSSDEEGLVTNAFGGAVKDHRQITTPRVSRKLEFIPTIQKVLSDS